MSGDVAAEVAAVLADVGGPFESNEAREAWVDYYQRHAEALAPLIAERVRAARAEALEEFHGRWFGVGWPGPEDIQEMHADLAAKIGRG